MAALKAEAVGVSIDDHLCLTPGFYQPPISRLARTFHTPGSGVGDLIRSSGNLLEAPGELFLPHMDLVGAGVDPVPWLALVGDDNARLSAELQNACRLRGSPRAGRNCERVSRFQAVSTIVSKAETRWRQLSDKNARSDCELRPPANCVLLCRSGDATAMTERYPECVAVEIECESLFFSGFVAIRALRPFYGEGWCPQIGAFRSVLEGARKKTGHSPGAVIANLEDVSARVASTGVEFFGHGWQVGGIAQRCERRPDSGIFVAPDAKLLDFWSETLPLDDACSRRLASAQSFESDHAQDRVVLAVRPLHYHGRPTKSEVPRWLVFPLLPPNAVQVVMRLAPSLCISLIGYRAGHSRTSEAGMLERLVGTVDREEGFGGSRALAAQIDRILDGQPLSMHASPPLDGWNLLGEKTNASSAGLSAVGRRFAFFWRWMTLISGMSQASTTARLRRVITGLFKLPADTADHLETTMGSSDPIAAYHALRQVEDEVAAVHGGDEEPGRRNRERFPWITLVSQTLHMIAGIYAGRLSVPKTLGDWAAKHMRFVLILPLDATAPLPGPVATTATSGGERPFAGDWQSWQSYRHLFDGEAGECRIEAPLGRLLKIARKALDPDSGWLANKCSETNELTVSLMRHHGYVNNFDLAGIPELAAGSDRSLLDSLDGRLIVRCLQSVPGGKKAMEKWIKNLTEEYEKLIQSEAKMELPKAGLKKEPEKVDSTQRELLSIFQDIEGMVAAAFDHARALPGAGVPKVYFRFDILRQVFRPESTRPIHSRSYDDTRTGFGDASFSQAAEDMLFAELTKEQFSPGQMLNLLEDWEASRGMGMGETVEDLLADFEVQMGRLAPKLQSRARRNFQRLQRKFNRSRKG